MIRWRAKPRLIGLALVLGGSAAIPAGSPGDILDTFDRAEIAPWVSGYKAPQFTISDGILSGRQINPQHAAVAMMGVPDFHDVRVEFDARFGDLRQIKIGLNDRKATDTIHAGHVARLTVFPGSITLSDDVARYSHAFRSSVPKEQWTEKLAGTFVTRQLARPVNDNAWHHYALEIRGDHARAEIDGVTVAELRSPGIAHPRIDELALGVSGTPEQVAQFDNFKMTRLK